jgi:hypothetical protein
MQSFNFSHSATDQLVSLVSLFVEMSLRSLKSAIEAGFYRFATFILSVVARKCVGTDLGTKH